MTLGMYIKSLREEKKYSQRKLALLANISNTTISRIENDLVTPDIDSLTKIATALNTPLESFLTFATEIPQSDLSKKEKCDIAKDLDQIKKQLLEDEELMFDGIPMSDDAIESILSALEIGMEIARKKNKAKYTPKKYRK